MTQTGLGEGQLCFRIVPLALMNSSAKFQIYPGFLLGKERLKVPIFGHFTHFFSFLGLVGGFLELKGPKLVPMIIIHTNEWRGDV